MRVETQILWVMCGMVGSQPVLGQETNTPARAPSALSRPAPPPPPKSPIAEFRQLLSLSPGERDVALAELSEGRRKSLRAKLEEYTALKPEERDSRLKATEMRWYLRPLLELAPTNRAPRVAAVPDEFRSQVEARLRQWDLLTPEVQKGVLQNERLIGYFVRIDSSARVEQVPVLKTVPAKRREELESGLIRWHALPAQTRQQMCERFQKYFELPPGEKVRTLSALSEAERTQMEDTLKAFGKLAPAERRLCINSFRKLANLSLAERAQFLENAERWKEMSPAERQTWRTLVTQLPPLPTRYGEPPPPPVPSLRPPTGSISLTNVGQ